MRSDFGVEVPARSTGSSALSVSRLASNPWFLPMLKSSLPPRRTHSNKAERLTSSLSKASMKPASPVVRTTTSAEL